MERGCGGVVWREGVVYMEREGVDVNHVVDGR